METRALSAGQRMVFEQIGPAVHQFVNDYSGTLHVSGHEVILRIFQNRYTTVQIDVRGRGEDCKLEVTGLVGNGREISHVAFFLKPPDFFVDVEAFCLALEKCIDVK